MEYYPNAFFTTGDPAPEYLHGFSIPSAWWSRRAEYFFAMRYAGAGQVVADMGAGWHYRPLHDALSNVCDWVYAVDKHEGILNEAELPPMKSGVFINDDFSQKIDAIPEASLDRIFCISVLEELVNYEDALKEFARLLKPDGIIVLTCDVPYDEAKPEHDLYKGIRLEDLDHAITRAGLRYTGSVCRVKREGTLYNEGFNLCVWHCTLRKA